MWENAATCARRAIHAESVDALALLPLTGRRLVCRASLLSGVMMFKARQLGSEMPSVIQAQLVWS